MAGQGTSSGIRGEAARCRELGVAAFLTKPISQSDLFDAIVKVLSSESSTAAADDKLVTRQTLRESKRSLHILLAEDNAVNQMLAVGLLQKRGHTVEIAVNGKEALAALEAGRFDAILMDIQMPEMSGFEATSAIREKEQATSERIPIIAMTAHAMKGDRERCIDAGMDGYVSKPIRAKDLFEAIDSLVPPSHPPAARSTDSNLTDRVFNRQALLSQFGGDLELMQRVTELFLKDAGALLSNISDAIARRDSRALEHAAHKLKGSVANFHAGTVVEAAQRLERIGRSRDLSGAMQAMAVLENEMRRLEPALIDLGLSAAVVQSPGAGLFVDQI